MKQILNNIKESLQHVPYTFKHICVLYKLQLKYIGYIKFPFHDMDKLFMYIFCGFLGVKRISKLHRKYASHHLSKNQRQCQIGNLLAIQNQISRSMHGKHA